MKHINNIISHPVSSQTIRRVLKKHSFKAVVKKKKPLLSPRHRKARLAFAQKYREWTVEDWKRVIPSTFLVHSYLSWECTIGEMTGECGNIYERA